MTGNLLRLPIVRTAGITAVMSATGAVAGLALDALLLFWFGAGVQTDALFAALVIPTLLNGIVAIQAPKILVPLFSTLFDDERSTVDAWAVLRNLLTVSTLTFAAVALLGVLVAPVAIPLQVPGLDAGAQQLTISLSRLLYATVVLQSLGFVVQAVLYAKQSYLVSSMPKLLINLTTIAVAYAFGPRGGGIAVVAWGMVAGSVVQLAFLCAALRRHGFRYHWTFNPSDATLRAIVRSFGYPIAGHVLGESGAIVQSVLASYFGSGSLTLLNYASRILGAVGGILLGSVVQVTLPMVAKHAAARDRSLQRQTLLEAIQILTLATVPLSVWLVFVAEPVVVLLFQRGQFSTADAALTASIIRVMVPYFFLARLVSVSQTLFYANGDLRTPFISTVIFTIVNTLLAILLAAPLREQGVGLALSVAAACNTVYMIVRLNRTFGPVGWEAMWPFCTRVAGSGALAAAGFALGLVISSSVADADWLSRVVDVALPSALGFSLFAAGIALFDFGTRQRIVAVASRFFQ